MVSGAFFSSRAGVGKGRERETLTKISSGIKMMIANFDSMYCKTSFISIGWGWVNLSGEGEGQ